MEIINKLYFNKSVNNLIKNNPIMKKTIVLALACLSTFGMNAQKKTNGTIYVEHPAITVVENFHKAFTDGDVNKVASFVTDDFKSFDASDNSGAKRDKAGLLKAVTYWKDNYDYTSLTRAKGAYPDALEYKEDLQKGEVWVQTWEYLKGTHKKTGVKIDMPIHRDYVVTKDLKIKLQIVYLNARPFDEIFYSESERKNGEIFINHENINTVRKMMAAFENKDFEKCYSYYDEKAKISDINDSDLNKFYSLTELKANDKVFLENFEIVRVDQVGYPDYLHYELMDARAVYSWWNFILIRKSDQKKINLPMMLIDNFNNTGKITSETMYFSEKILESK
jgi:ketosteroid isomerase-like protein